MFDIDRWAAVGDIRLAARTAVVRIHLEPVVLAEAAPSGTEAASHATTLCERDPENIAEFVNSSYVSDQQGERPQRYR